MTKDRVKFVVRLLLALLFTVGGALHFTHTQFYLAIMPPYLPHHLALVYLSGFFEIMGGIGLLIPALSRFAGYGLVALLIAVFPANIYMAVNHLKIGGASFPSLLLWLRLPLQFVLMALVLWCARRRSS